MHFEPLWISNIEEYKTYLCTQHSRLSMGVSCWFFLYGRLDQKWFCLTLLHFLFLSFPTTLRILAVCDDFNMISEERKNCESLRILSQNARNVKEFHMTPERSAFWDGRMLKLYWSPDSNTKNSNETYFCRQNIDMFAIGPLKWLTVRKGSVQPLMK